MPAESATVTRRDIPTRPGGLPGLGHIVAFARNPFRFMQETAQQLGEIARFKMFNQTIVLLTGDEASQVFYRSSDDALDQSAAYRLMTPIFGEGIIFDAPNDIKNQQLKMLMPSLRMESMRHHAGKILTEVDAMMARWGAGGDLELVSEMKQLTIHTASHCLLGQEFRYELTREFAEIYHDLEKGVNVLAYHFPYLPLPAFRKRDRARRRLQALVGAIVERRQAMTEKPEDMFQTLIDTRYTDGSALSTNEITGLLIGAIFAGHHTSSGTAAWVLIELLRHPQWLKRVRQEIQTVIGEHGEITFQSLRELHQLEWVIKEVLRLHPPLIVLMRQVTQPLEFKGYRLEPGDMIWASPPVTHRLGHLFPSPEQFDPERFSPARAEDKNLMAFQPFGGGKHKCSGNAFAVFQIKAIFAQLLRHYDFYLTDAPERYHDDYSQMIVQPHAPCRVRYTRRVRVPVDTADPVNAAPPPGCPFHGQTTVQTDRWVVRVDEQLCQGHAMCMGEAPDLFQVDTKGPARLIHVPDTPEALKRAHHAARHCPNHAIHITRE